MSVWPQDLFTQVLRPADLFPNTHAYRLLIFKERFCWLVISTEARLSPAFAYLVKHRSIFFACLLADLVDQLKSMPELHRRSKLHTLDIKPAQQPVHPREAKAPAKQGLWLL
jgi:hypothetical protein